MYNICLTLRLGRRLGPTALEMAWSLWLHRIQVYGGKSAGSRVWDLYQPNAPSSIISQLRHITFVVKSHQIKNISNQINKT